MGENWSVYVELLQDGKYEADDTVFLLTEEQSNDLYMRIMRLINSFCDERRK